MNKEEILEKARKDSDEMELSILTKSLGLSTIIIPSLAIIFILFRIINAEYIISDLVAITLAQLSVSQIYQGIKMKKSPLLVLGFICLILTIIFTIFFIKEVSL